MGAERSGSSILPEFQEELRHKGASTFYREAFAALIRTANSLVATREVIDEGEIIIRQARWDAEEAQARAEAAERALEAARTDRAAEIREAESRAEVEANRLRAALNQLGEAESVVEARDLHIVELDSAIWAAKTRAERAEERAGRAEEKEREAASLAAEKEAKAQEVEAAAEARVAAAVDEFRTSERFMDELAETLADAYLQGF